MSRQEQDREDLLREATALVERIELIVDWRDDSLVCGFRRDGSLSLFLGADPVYQFNSQRELRRGYQAGRLLKSERRELVWLDRERTTDATLLVRSPLDADEKRDYLQQLNSDLESLEKSLASNAYQVVGCEPQDATERVLARIADWLASRPRPVTIATTPRVS